MAKPVLDLLRGRRPDLQVAYTWFSPSAEAFGHALGADIADYLPFDTSAAAHATLDALQPSALVFSKLDVWPLLTEAAVARGIPVALTSASLAAASGRRSLLARWLLADAYRALAVAGAVGADDATRLIELGVRVERMSVTGDTRYDQVWARVHAPTLHAGLIAQLTSTRPTLVAGSTWPADDIVLIRAWREVRRLVPDARLIVAPHEPDTPHVSELHERFLGAGLSAATLGEASADTDVVIVDRLGVLADLYALATAAYVGGGFHAAGLHSVVEPAAYGAPVIFGPYHGASRDAMALIAAGGGVSVRNAAELGRAAVTLIQQGPACDAAGAAARSVVVAGLGAAERTADLVLALIARDCDRETMQ